MTKNMLLCASLILYSGTISLALGEEQREILYTLNEANQDFSNFPPIVENRDMFIGVFEMNIQHLERKLAAINQKMNNAALKTSLFVGINALLPFVEKGLASLNNSSSIDFSYLEEIKFHALIALRLVLGSYVGINLYDTVKARNDLKEALELDRAILEKLKELQYASDFNNPIESNPLINPTPIVE